MGFLLPVYATPDGMMLSGHQRLKVSQELGFEHMPVEYTDIDERSLRGINIIFNRATNDFNAFDTGSGMHDKMDLTEIIEMCEAIPDVENENWYALDAKLKSISNIGKGLEDQYDKKAIVIASNLMRKNIHMPIVIDENGTVLNGVHRLLCAKEKGVNRWPLVEVPSQISELARNMLNYLSMDYHVDEDFADMLRYSAYRRPQNNRGSVPKAYRFWANGERTLLDKDSYTTTYWREFRDLHGRSILDFGAGLGKVSPFLQSKGIDCIDFEPYRIDPEKARGKPDVELSIRKAGEFLELISDPEKRFNSIFLASVLNSIPFPKDRMAVLAIVNALSSFDTVVYGTCRDISDFEYEYGGIRNANYFVFDSEPGVRLGDSLHNPKIQKFHTQKEAKTMFDNFWKTADFWPGGNVFYFRVKNPKRANPKVLAQALEIEFDLPYSTGARMGLVDEAKEAFSKRLGLKIE